MATISKLVGVLITLAAFAAVSPMMLQAVDAIVPYTGPVTDLIIILIPVGLAFSILSDAVEKEQVQ